MGQFHLVTIANPEECFQCRISLSAQAWKRRFHKALYCKTCADAVDAAEATKAARASTRTQVNPPKE